MTIQSNASPSPTAQTSGGSRDPLARPGIAPGLIQMNGDKEEKKPEGGGLEEKLFKTRQLMLSGGVNEKLARGIITSLLALEADDPKKPITILMNSPGGSVNDGMAIYDTIRFIEAPVRIVCLGLAASIATIILIAADKSRRLCLPNTRLLIHQPLIPMQVFGPASDLEITATEILKTREKINHMLADACGQPLARVEKDTQRDYWMSAEQALEYGLISGIVSTRAELEAL
ncbi:MAG: ATP-dependent Clp protease proteolytic subunit 2 [Myxococcales bacterium]